MKRGESTIAQGKPRSGAALGMEKKVNGVRRSEAEEADSRIAPSIVCKSLALTQIKRAPVPARSVASLRSSPLSVGLRCVADAPSLRAQFHFFTIPKAAPLRGLPWAIILSPRFAGLKIPLAYGSQTNLQLPIYRAGRGQCAARGKKMGRSPHLFFACGGIFDIVQDNIIYRGNT